jgi:hypothetical protein
MSVDGPPPKGGGKEPDRKAFCRRIAELALKAALAVAFRALFERFWQ